MTNSQIPKATARDWPRRGTAAWYCRSGRL